MITVKKAAYAMAGNSARPCNNCLHKPARWYCPADDAFLCQTCDASVHSANQLARRHERVRLHAAASSKNDSNSAPAWHQGFTRKARSPRNVKRTPPPPPSKHDDKFPTPPPLVPEIGSEETSPDENDEQFLYRVPTFDPFLDDEFGMEYDSKPLLEEIGDLDSLSGFLPSDMDLAEFAADVESYLGAGLDDEIDACLGDMKIKHEQVEAEANLQLTQAWSLNHESIVMGEEEEEEHEEKRRKISLSLNYEDVITAWASQGSPWTTGNRPKFDPNDYYWLDYMGTCSTDFHGGCGVMGGGVEGRNYGGDGGREARVSRYREKRRTRLFSKKIRYEVRKLNAEKRPRMKGRFVKRASMGAGPQFSLLQR